MQAVKECYNSPNQDFPSETNGDEKMETEDASPITYERSMTGMEEEKSSRQGKYSADGGGEGLKSGFDYSRFFSRRTTVLVSIGVATLAIFAAHKIMSRQR